MSQDHKMRLAKSLFDMHITQNRDRKNIDITDSLLYAAAAADVNIFELSKVLGYRACLKKEKIKKDKK